MTSVPESKEKWKIPRNDQSRVRTTDNFCKSLSSLVKYVNVYHLGTQIILQVLA